MCILQNFNSAELVPITVQSLEHKVLISGEIITRLSFTTENNNEQAQHYGNLFMLTKLKYQKHLLKYTFLTGRKQAKEIIIWAEMFQRTLHSNLLHMLCTTATVNTQSVFRSIPINH